MNKTLFFLFFLVLKTSGILAQQPDLMLENGTFSYDSVLHKLTVTVDVKNNSTTDVAVGTGGRVGFYLSTDTTVNGNDYFFASLPLSAGISGNSCYCNVSAEMTDLTLTGAPSGTYNIIAKADDLNKIPELNETNNLLHLGSFAYISPAGIIGFSSQQNSPIKLLQNAPNPFHKETQFSFFIYEKTYITLKIYDVLGQETITLLNQELQAGKHTCKLSGNSLEPGIYYYTLTSLKTAITKKMCVVRE